jgi:hypothetical protein
MEALMVESESITNTFGHNGIRGTIREVFVKQLLEPFLPPQIGIGTGEIINHEGKRSKQIDVVLYNKERVPPVLLSGSDIGLFPWECVVSVIEVKSKLNVGALQDAHVNAASVKQVYSTPNERDVLVSGLRPLADMFSYGPIPYYVFAFNSDLTDSKETNEIQYGMSTECIGKEGCRLFSSFESLVKNRRNYEEILANDNSSNEDKDNATKHLSKMGGVDIHLEKGNIHGVCVASREWTHGHMRFESKVFSQYSKNPIRIASNWNYHWKSYFNKGRMNDVLSFMAHMIELSYEMPKCREHYNIARYLSD